MPIYEYSALNIKGKSVTDIIDAENIVLARQKLRTANIYPISIREVYDAAPSKEIRLSFLTKFFLPKVKSAELSIMTRQLATLLGAGFPLVSALYTLVPQTRSHSFKRILSRSKTPLKKGAVSPQLYPNTRKFFQISILTWCAPENLPEHLNWSLNDWRISVSASKP